MTQYFVMRIRVKIIARKNKIISPSTDTTRNPIWRLFCSQYSTICDDIWSQIF
jgi:hypothetical protein